MEPAVDRRTLREEILVVLMLSLLASAVYAVIDLLSAPIAGVYVPAADQSSEFAKQVAGFVFGLAPVYLVLHLVRRSGDGVRGIGLDATRPWQDLGRGVVLAVIIGVGGIGIYLASVALGVNRFVVPVPPLGHWWTIPAVLLNAAGAALKEEVIVVAYLVTRLQQVGWSDRRATVASGLLRGAYHLYQGFGAFTGNLVMGLLFAWMFTRTRRARPFVVAHLLIDVGAGVGFILFRHHLPGF
ncbi:MAG: CPBP family intramembrane glutamic endopeptidase [Actinomycetota bacterium]